MPFTETGSEKAKREAYMKANKERGIRQEQQRDYKMFGTTEQNTPAVDTMGNVTGMKTGGSVKHNVDTSRTVSYTHLTLPTILRV